MKRLRWPMLVFLCCLPVVILALDIPIPGLTKLPTGPAPVTVPVGDTEMAWLHTTTNGATWERFVAGMQRVVDVVPQLNVDVSRAFPDRTHEVPEVILTRNGVQGRLRIRWYKIGTEATTQDWVQALAKRNPAPLAIIGGGSSDRAKELAQCMNKQITWQGTQPLLFITTASADEVEAEGEVKDGRTHVNLVEIYPGRTFRFCFTNKQMADAVLDFVWATPELKPELLGQQAMCAVASTLITGNDHPTVYTTVWQDDPYSTDLSFQFRNSLYKRPGPLPRFFKTDLPLSIGRFAKPNRAEAEAAELILKDFQTLPPQRGLLVLPTIPAPARRILSSLYDANPELARRLVAVNGDGISVNVIYRDGAFSWPFENFPIPMVFFTHNDPVHWDKDSDGPNRPALRPPTSTEDVLHFAEMTRIVAETTITEDGLSTNSDALKQRLNLFSPAYFDGMGNRIGGTGEYVIVFRPTQPSQALLEVWKRAGGSAWAKIHSLNLPLPRGSEGGNRE